MKPYILIIDDDVLYASAVARQLEAANLHTRIAHDSVTALAEIDGERPDLILLDVNMPGVDGIDLCRHIKTLRRDLGIPTLILTALRSAEVRNRALGAGADTFLTKPVAPADLLCEVRNLIERPTLALAGQRSGEGQA